MSRIFVILLMAILVLGVNKAIAVPATLTLTADNFYYTITVKDSLGTRLIAPPYTGDNTNWVNAESYTFDLREYETSMISITCFNDLSSPNSPINPAGFLAQLTLNTPGYFFNETNVNRMLSGDESYMGIVPYGFGIVQTPTSYGRNDDPTTIWYGANGNKPVTGIDGAAEWVWTDGNFNSQGDQLAIISMKATAAVPEPATMLLLGPALLGLTVLRGRKRI